jgi:hypothetical protein
MGYIKQSLNPRSVIRKILAAFLLAFIAVILAQSISRYSFRELLGTVEDLSEPNEKLGLLNSVFHELTTLDQMQRAEAITNPKKPYTSFLNQSANLNRLIDSLTNMPWDTSQLNRLVQMKDVLTERNKLFFSYLKVKAEILDNRKFSVQLDTQPKRKRSPLICPTRPGRRRRNTAPSSDNCLAARRTELLWIHQPSKWKSTSASI